MGKSTSHSSLNNALSDSQHQSKRLECLICDRRISLNDESLFATFPCNVRAFKEETFKVWRCPNCRSIHCLDSVALADYYAKYPFAQARLTFPLRLCYRNLCRQLTKHGFSQSHSLLDYGCASGTFIKYLQQRGFPNCFGYDPYASQDGLGNPATLQQGPFDYILLQDVIEHVEDPNQLLNQLDALLSPGGYVLIGTPNAAKIDLAQPSLSDYYNPVHAPYHIHIYTQESLEFLGRKQGWEPVDFFGRPYHDTLWFGLNSRAWNEYQRLCDGTLDVVYESIKTKEALTSLKFIFYALFGYWLSFRTEMAVMFHKRV